MKKLLAFLAALSLAGCGSTASTSESNSLVSTDFETMGGWLPQPQAATLTHEKAHSGHYALQVDANHPYSLTFHAPLGKLRDTRPKKIRVAAWAFVSDTTAKATLVTTLSNPAASAADKPLLWEGITLDKRTLIGKWVEVSKVIALPDNAASTSVLGLYLWSTGSQPVFLDDVRVTVEP